MESLKSLCVSVVRENVHEYHQPSCLQLLQDLYAILGDSHSPAIQRLLELVDGNGYLAVTSGLFCQLSAHLVSVIVQRDTLHVDEVTLFKMVIRWSEAVCRRRALPMTLDNQRAVLRGILHHIRFTTVSLNDFRLMLRVCPILSDEQISHMVRTADSTLPYNAQPRTLTNKQIYIVGGMVNGPYSASVLTYSLDRGCQLTQINMNEGRRGHCAAYCHSNKQMVVVGGYVTCSTAETCTLTGDTPLFTTMTIKEPRVRAACICIGSKAYFMGGLGSQTCECYDMQQGTWTDMQPLPYPVAYACCALCEDGDQTTILLMGGINDETGAGLDTVWQYWPEKDQWQDRADLRLPHTLFLSSAVNWCGTVLIVGGMVGGHRARNLCYTLDMVNRQWVSMPPLNTPRYAHQAVVLDGKIVVIGGLDGGFNALNSVEVFDGEKWTHAPPLDATITEFAALVI